MLCSHNHHRRCKRPSQYPRQLDAGTQNKTLSPVTCNGRSAPIMSFEVVASADLRERARKGSALTASSGLTLSRRGCSVISSLQKEGKPVQVLRYARCPLSPTFWPGSSVKLLKSAGDWTRSAMRKLISTSEKLSCYPSSRGGRLVCDQARLSRLSCPHWPAVSSDLARTNG
jgi:hypothetical protein